MRMLWIGLVIVLLVTLSLSIGLNIGLILNRQPSSDDNMLPIYTPSAQPKQTTPSPTPISPVTATPSPRFIAITDQNITLNYSEYSKQILSENAKIVLSVSVEYRGSPVSLDYSRFMLKIYTPTGGLVDAYVESGIIAAKETGTFVVGGSNGETAFQLTFEYQKAPNSNAGLRYELLYI